MSIRQVNEHSTDMCAACDTDLAYCDTIQAAEGVLYCSKDCAVHDLRVKYGDKAEEVFNDAAEELVPRDIGILPHTCEWCEEEYEELVKTDLGWLCERCICAIRSRGETVKEER